MKKRKRLQRKTRSVISYWFLIPPSKLRPNRLFAKDSFKTMRDVSRSLQNNLRNKTRHYSFDIFLVLLPASSLKSSLQSRAYGGRISRTNWLIYSSIIECTARILTSTLRNYESSFSRSKWESFAKSGRYAPKHRPTFIRKTKVYQNRPRK